MLVWLGDPSFVYQQMDFVILFVTQCILFSCGNAVRTDKDRNQYVDLSIACITVPDTCGPEGATISLWFKIDTCIFGGLISSRSSSTYGTGLSLIGHLSCHLNTCLFTCLITCLMMQSLIFKVTGSKTAWTLYSV